MFAKQNLFTNQPTLPIDHVSHYVQHHLAALSQSYWQQWNLFTGYQKSLPRRDKAVVKHSPIAFDFRFMACLPLNHFQFCSRSRDNNLRKAYWKISPTRCQLKFRNGWTKNSSKKSYGRLKATRTWRFGIYFSAALHRDVMRSNHSR